MMSYWTFSDVFEEQGVVKTPFYGGYGLIAAYGIPKPAYNAFKLLHKLGDQRIALDSDSALLTRRGDGTWVLAVWNYAPPEQAGLPRTLTLRFQNTKPQLATLSRLDSEHGDFHSAYEKMGSPRYPTQTQIQELRRVTELPDPQIVKLQNDELNVTLPAHGLALIEVK
jgi:xylan 1,4-beta-xylosidase